MSGWKYFVEITAPSQFVIGKYYAILDASSLKQIDCFLCNNINVSAEKLDYYKGKCLIVEYLTDAEIERAISSLRNENNAEYWRFVRSAHSKSTAPLMRCVELQRERGALQKWLNGRLLKGANNER